jgi:hypothetical protein
MSGLTGMTTGEFPPESKFGTLEYWRDRAKKLEAKCRTIEEELAILKAKLSEMIIVGGTCLACSPDVRTAYHEREIEKDEFYRTFTEISAINDALVELSNKKGVEHKQQIAALKAENKRLTESRNNCQREYLLMRDTARQLEAALTASQEEVEVLTAEKAQKQIVIDNQHQNLIDLDRRVGRLKNALNEAKECYNECWRETLIEEALKEVK